MYIDLHFRRRDFYFLVLTIAIIASFILIQRCIFTEFISLEKMRHISSIFVIGKNYLEERRIGGKDRIDRHHEV